MPLYHSFLALQILVYIKPNIEHNKEDKSLKYLKDTVQYFICSETEQLINHRQCW